MSLPKPYYQDDYCTIYNADCRKILPFLEPVDLVLTDPPYGINENDKKVASRGKLANCKDYGVFNWDKKLVEQWVIDSLIANSRYQVIWGGNYYKLPPCKGPLVWDKLNTGDFADGEMAWNNYGSALRIIQHLWNGMIRKNQEDRFHPTQKPVDVIKWAISLCPIQAQTILDPFMGSGTTLRAAKDLNRKAIGIEIEEKYCEIAVERLRQEVLAL
jgi:DNA modification methylase